MSSLEKGESVEMKLRRLDALATRIKDELKYEPELQNKEKVEIARTRLQEMTASTPINEFDQWLEINSSEWLSKPVFFYLIAEIYQKRRLN